MEYESKRFGGRIRGMIMINIRVHRADCKGVDERINCIGCFKAEVISILNSCHDHLYMDPTGRGCQSVAFEKVTRFLEADDLYN